MRSFTKFAHTAQALLCDFCQPWCELYLIHLQNISYYVIILPFMLICSYIRSLFHDSQKLPSHFLVRALSLRVKTDDVYISNRPDFAVQFSFVL